MKRLVFSLFFLLLVGIVFGQNNTDIKKHEVKINGLLLAASTTIDLSYEYVKNPSTGFGVSVLWNMRDKEFPMERFSVTPFYRIYFFSKKDYGANGIFVEGFVKMASAKNFDYKYDDQNSNGVTNMDPKFNTALGICIGKKWVNKSNFSLEIFIGSGATIKSSNKIDNLPRVGINIAKRF